MTARSLFLDPNFIDPEELARARIRTEIDLLAAEREKLDKYRDYFSGDQKLAFTSPEFIRQFGGVFDGFSDNWCKVVVNTMRRRMTLTGVSFGAPGSVEAEENRDLSKQVWDIFKANDIDEEQIEAHEGALVEGRSAFIVWPDKRKKASIQWQPAQLIQVRYSEDDRREPVWAVKRWEDTNGEIRITLYTPEWVYKFVENDGLAAAKAFRSADDAIPAIGNASGFKRREVPGEPWPLPNPFPSKRVPVVQLNNWSRDSEIVDTIPQQDALNRVLIDIMLASNQQGTRQRAVSTTEQAPVGGWRNVPGSVWHFQPMLEADGSRMVHPLFHDFEASDPSNMIKTVEMFLQHIALTSETPIRYFYSADRGGRGDAPSGDSLVVSDDGLNAKVEDAQTLIGNSEYRVASLVAEAAKLVPNSRDLPPGEVLWKGFEDKYRQTVLDQAAIMVNIGLPFKHIITKLGLNPDEIDRIVELKEEEEDKKRAEAEKMKQLELPPGVSRTTPPTSTEPKNPNTQTS